jgi:hypothetical protein
MKPEIQLTIPTPCSEHWARMSPARQGRFCGACQKTVVDFTAMSDQDLVQWFARHEGSVCGRFSKDQLERPLAPQPKPKKIHWRYWHYLIAGLLFSSEVSAQTKPVSPTINQRRPESNTLMGDTVLYIPKYTLTDSIRGRVMDEGSRPIANATIMYSGQQGVLADADGYFSIPSNHIHRGELLTISAIGYETVRVNADTLRKAGQKTTYLTVSMETSVTMGLVAVAVSPKKRADTASLFKDTLASMGLTKPALMVYPNPVARGSSLNLSVRLDQAGTCRIQLFTSAGALVQTTEVTADRLSVPISMTIPASLTPGNYFIKLSHPALSRCYSQEIMVF